MNFVEAVNFKKLTEVRKNFAKFIKFASNLKKKRSLRETFWKFFSQILEKLHFEWKI